MLGTEREVVSHVWLERIAAARRCSDAIFELVRADFLYERPIPERHRIIFYLGHLEAFDCNLLNKVLFGLQSFDPEFDRLFAFGIDPVGGGLPTDVPSDWPSLATVRQYLKNSRRALDEKLAGVDSDSDISTRDGFSLSTLLNVAVEHRLMHVETLSYMLHQLPFHMKLRPIVSQHKANQPVVPEMVSIPAGTVTLGLLRSSDAFGWDNEFEEHSTEAERFEIDKYKVTNRQYLEFVMAGGYEMRPLWTDEDWEWKTARAISHPLFWKREGDNWVWRTMFDELPLPPDWPVYVSHAEASAYARWAGKSLPTETEWQRAAYGTTLSKATSGRADRVNSTNNDLSGPNTEAASRLGNFDFQRWDPVPVNFFASSQSAFGVRDLLGNGWEWTSSVFAPFPGFQPFPFYRGYSADFFDGKHFVMKGGSARTAACMLRPTFRNWFQGHYQYVYAGFRCVRR